MSDGREELPIWARRMRAEREARNWSQRDAVRALRTHSSEPLVSEETLRRNWKRWEAGTVQPDDFYAPLIAKTFGTVTNALFPVKIQPKRGGDLLSDAETLEIIGRLSISDVSTTTLDALRITVEQLCSEYPHMPPAALRTEGRAWLRRVTNVLGGRLTLAQHREVLDLSGWLALLVGCVEYDMGSRRSADSTRRAALALGAEAEDAAIQGWAHEMQAWFALTTGDYRGVIAAAESGQHVAGNTGVSVQLAAQSAKAWARIGDRRQMEVALDRGRNLLERLPYPDNVENHFVVDPAKFDFYAMDCYRAVGENQLAQAYAEEVLRAGTAANGQEHSPMRNAEARITLGVVAARQGDIDLATHHGQNALNGDRQSIPSLLMCSKELVHTLEKRHADAPEVRDYLARLDTLRNTAA
jgi:tetratricopeptide (TPR) repeat protein